MEFKNIKQNEFFTIGEIPSYPKLRIKDGYIDIRDGIVKKVNDLSWTLRTMEETEVLKQLNCTKEELDNHLKLLKEIYI